MRRLGFGAVSNSSTGLHRYGICRIVKDQRNLCVFLVRIGIYHDRIILHLYEYKAQDVCLMYPVALIMLTGRIEEEQSTRSSR